MRVPGIIVLLLCAIAGCGDLTDPATRLGADLVAGASRLGSEEGAVSLVRHAMPSRAGQCTGPYKVQFDAVGALIVWCQDERGNTVSSHSTTHHAPHVDTGRTLILDRPAGAVLTIRLERRNGRALIVDVS